jgi:hypothetical protein
MLNNKTNKRKTSITNTLKKLFKYIKYYKKVYRKKYSSKIIDIVYKNSIKKKK